MINTPNQHWDSQKSQEKMNINSIEEYKSVKAGWVEPLSFFQLFEIEPSVRKQIIKSMFPVSNPENDSKFYRWMWDINAHWCENCGKPLKTYWAGYISHIMSRGAHTECRYDPLNVNILCNTCHSKWETGTLKEKRSMYVYWTNIERMDILRKSYIVQ